MRSIYVASKAKHADKWKELRSKGLNIISTWLDEAATGQTKDWMDLGVRCVNEVKQADYLLFYCEPGEIFLGAFIELGVATVFDKKCYIVGPIPTRLKHPNWISCGSIMEALQSMQEVSVVI